MHRPSIDIAAPGGSDETQVVSTTAGTGWYGGKMGTSMAAPHAAGVASIIWSLRPNTPAYQVRSLIISCGASFPALAPDVPSARRLDARCPVDFLLQNPWWHQ